ncbi:hypothetical protein C8F01DRAFT_1263652 [Mycena amicta]|nr:hypothetical protein C8F01DRAFT_1263652 [Mycena amicta]
MAHPAPPTPVLSFAGQVPAGSVAAVCYEADSGDVRIIAWPWSSLQAAKAVEELTPLLANNSVSCSMCVRPHAAEQDAHYTVLVTCPHCPDDSPFFQRNAAIDRILPEPLGTQKRLLSPLGDVVVVRHAPAPTDEQDLRRHFWSGPLQSITVDEGPVVHSIVCQAVEELDNLPPRANPLLYFHHYEALERLRNPDGSAAVPVYWENVDVARGA